VARVLNRVSPSTIPVKIARIRVKGKQILKILKHFSVYQVEIV